MFLKHHRKLSRLVFGFLSFFATHKRTCAVSLHMTRYWLSKHTWERNVSKLSQTHSFISGLLPHHLLLDLLCSLPQEPSFSYLCFCFAVLRVGVGCQTQNLVHTGPFCYLLSAFHSPSWGRKRAFYGNSAGGRIASVVLQGGTLVGRAY